MKTIRECKEGTVLPSNGTLVKIGNDILPKDGCGGFLVKQKYIDCRRTNENGTYVGWFPGAGGDIWAIEHEDGTTGAYVFDEIFDRE